MNQLQNSKRQENAWLASAVTAPLVHSAGDYSWLAALVAGTLALFSVYCVKRFPGEPGKYLKVVQNIWICFLLTGLMRWSGAYWPGHSNGAAAPLILLALGVWAAWKCETRAAGIGNTLLWPLLLVIGGVLLSALGDLEPARLMPRFRMNSADLITVVIIFAGAKEAAWGKNHQIAAVAGAGAVAAVIGAVLPGWLRGTLDAPFYELSRSLSLFGVVERFESLAAAAMTVGFFVSMSYLLCKVGKGIQILPWAAVSAVLYVAGIALDGRILAAGSVVLWIMVPSLQNLKKIFQNHENTP